MKLGKKSNRNRETGGTFFPGFFFFWGGGGGGGGRGSVVVVGFFFQEKGQRGKTRKSEMEELHNLPRTKSKKPPLISRLLVVDIGRVLTFQNSKAFQETAKGSVPSVVSGVNAHFTRQSSLRHHFGY